VFVHEWATGKSCFRKKMKRLAADVRYSYDIWVFVDSYIGASCSEDDRRSCLRKGRMLNGSWEMPSVLMDSRCLARKW
jgi:hypothetical protein